MNRYCPNCQEEFDFKVTSMAQLENLICPKCGGVVGKESRRPKSAKEIEDLHHMENQIGKGLMWWRHLMYILYVFFALAGIGMFFLKAYTALYIFTIIAVCTYVFRFYFVRNGYIFMFLGAVAGYYFFETLQGVCVGICGGLVVVYLMRRLMGRLFGKAISFARKAGSEK